MTSHRDAQRIEEEIAGAERLVRPRGLASSYLQQAAEAFHAAGDPAHLYRQWRSGIPPKPFGWELMRRWACEERFRQGRTCALFCALAAEAYVNEFIAAFGLSRPRLKRLDRLSTVRKYVEGTREAYGESLFREDDEVVPTLSRLFALRHELVHPKPGLGPPGLLAPDDPETAARFALTELAEYLVVVGGAADLLTWRAYGYGHTDVPGSTLWRARSAIRGYATRRVELPMPDEPDEPPIWRTLGAHLDSHQAPADDSQATWTRVRQARRGDPPPSDCPNQAGVGDAGTLTP